MRKGRSIDTVAGLERAHGALLSLVRRIGALARAAWRSPALREGALACTTFAAILGLTIAGVDYIITGGPTWNPGGVAYAHEAAPVRAPSAPAPIIVAYEPPPPAPLYAEDYAIFEFAAMSPDALLGGPVSSGLQNAAYTITPPRLSNSRPSYVDNDPYARRVLREEDVVLTDEVSSPKQAF